MVVHAVLAFFQVGGSSFDSAVSFAIPAAAAAVSHTADCSILLGSKHRAAPV